MPISTWCASSVQNGGREQLMFAHRFDKSGMYYVRVTDYQHSGRAGHFYRIVAGEFSLVTGAYPLGVRKGAAGEVALRGFHVAAKLKVDGKPSPRIPRTRLLLRPEHAFNQVRSGSARSRRSLPQGGAIPVPVTVNGRIAAAGAENRYRFQARKGEPLVLEVNARRLGSELDSDVEVLDAKGNPIERAWSGRSGRRTSRCATTTRRAGGFASPPGAACRPAIT